MFNKCLSGKIKNEIEYENVLDCKSVAFQDYMDRVLDFEEKYLNDALNKYAKRTKEDALKEIERGFY